MIKSLNRGDILVTPFEAQKNWDNNNLIPFDLILWQSQSINTISGVTSSLTGYISHTYLDYGDNTTDPISGTPYPITNSYCNLALQQQTLGYVKYQKGVFNQSVLYPTASFYTASSKYYNSSSNPRNIDGTYMNIVYDATKHLFYNNYNNFTKTFGMETADLTVTNRFLTNTMDVFTVPRINFGEKILPNSVVIRDSSFDKPYTIIDDGNCNLIFSGSIFSTYEIDNLLSSSANATVLISSLDCNASASYTASAIVTQSVGTSGFYYANSSQITTNISGGVYPYNYFWYIAGDNAGYWSIIGGNQPNIIIQYNTLVNNLSNINYSNTYVLCQVIDSNNTNVFSNQIYLTHC